VGYYLLGELKRWEGKGESRRRYLEIEGGESLLHCVCCVPVCMRVSCRIGARFQSVGATALLPRAMSWHPTTLLTARSFDKSHQSQSTAVEAAKSSCICHSHGQ